VTSDLSLCAETDDPLPADIDPLLASKFAVPKAPPFSVLRERLVDRLSEAVGRPLTAVIGPAGSGKTQLVASWASSGRTPGPIIWITLEDGDDEPEVFWPYFIEGLRRGGIGLSPAVEEAGHGGRFNRSVLVRLAADLAAHRSPVVLVLDSVSIFADHKMAADLDAVLRHADHNLRMVLVGRWDPPFPLYRYRLAGTLTEFRAADLAFTTAEAAALLNGHGVRLPDCALTSLVERTEGWAAGLRLSALALQGRGDAKDLVVTIAGDDANIAEYFLGEVLSAQPPEVRDFLLRTSIVETFTPELAEALSQQDGARHILAVLERANAFVQPVADHSTVHRYHRLFAELLRAELIYQDPAEALRLHRRAAAWFAAHGRTLDAIRHAVDAGDWEHACALTVQDFATGRLLAGGETDRLGRFFRTMPEDGVDGPEAAVVLAGLRLAAGDAVAAAKHLARVADHLDEDPGEQSVPLRFATALLDAYAGTLRRNCPQILRAADEAAELLARAPAERVAAHPELRTILSYSRGVAYSCTGALDDAAAALRDGVAAASSPGCERLRLACLEQLALVQAYRCRLDEAAEAAGEAAQLAAERGRTAPHHLFAATVALAWVACERWTVSAAWRHLRAAEAVADDRADALALVAAALVRSRLLEGRGELQGAARVLGEVRERGSCRELSWLDDKVILSQARLSVAMGRPVEALAAVAALADRDGSEAAIVTAAALLAAGDGHRVTALVRPIASAPDLPTPLAIEAWLTLAVAAGERGEGDGVRDALGKALALAPADTHRRVFHQAGSRVRQLLRGDPELAALYRSLGTPAPAEAHHRAGPAQIPVDEPILVDALSQRELQVLQFLAAMLSTEEIAEAMYVSVNTVKTHVRSILRKLSASRRNEAVRRARALGLV
jgi:LuxR family maltose regulon positive regulatory protein